MTALTALALGLSVAIFVAVTGFTLAYFAWVRKFRASRPKASRDTSSRASFRYVFITSAEPYSSTN